jgi:hypothetical protein
MSTPGATVLGLCEHLDFIRTCPVLSLILLVSNLQLHGHLLLSFLDTLDESDKIVCYRAALLCYSVTGSTQIPHEMQLKVILAIKNGKDSLVSAGTGSGKTLPIALSMLLDDPEKKLITVTLSPLKRLQMTQESDFNTQYGIPTVVINEDTPREEAWWTVSRISFKYIPIAKICRKIYGISRGAVQGVPGLSLLRSSSSLSLAKATFLSLLCLFATLWSRNILLMSSSMRLIIFTLLVYCTTALMHFVRRGVV